VITKGQFRLTQIINTLEGHFPVEAPVNFANEIVALFHPMPALVICPCSNVNLVLSFINHHHYSSFQLCTHCIFFTPSNLIKSLQIHSTHNF